MQADDLSPVLQSLIVDPAELSQAAISFWDETAARSATPDPLSCGHAWQTTALVCSRRAGAPIFLRRSDDSQIVFALTGSSSEVRLGPLEAHWSFGCPLLGPGSIELLIETIGELKRSRCPGQIIIDIPGLNPDGELTKAIESAFNSWEIFRQDPHAAASLESGLEGWLSRRSGNFRRKLRKAEGAALRRGVVFERHAPCSPLEADDLYSRMLKIEATSWKGAEGHGLLALNRFYGMLLRAYAQQGAARVIVARAEDNDIGFCFGGEALGIYRGQQTSYAEPWRDFSIGALMHQETARWLCEDGARLQHFGPIQRSLSYKARFCELQYPSVRALIRLRARP